MGLGKTVQVVALLAAMYRKTNTSLDRRALKLRRRALEQSEREDLDEEDPMTVFRRSPSARVPTLILCPASVVSQWARELETWGYFSTLVVTTLDAGAEREEAISEVRRGYYEIVLSSYGTMFNQRDCARGILWSSVVLDEAHKLKNPKSRTNLWVRSLNTECRYALSGTTVQVRATPDVLPLHTFRANPSHSCI